MLVKKPRVEQFMGIEGREIAFPNAERDYHRARAEFAIASIERALKSVQPKPLLKIAIQQLKDNE